MRILQICSAREIGGGEIHLVDLVNGLADRGHEVFVALSPASPLIGRLSALPAENIIELPMRNALNIATAMKLSRFVRSESIAIVHAHVARDYLLATLATDRSESGLVLTRHVLFPLHRIHRLTLRRTSRVIAVSRAVAESLLSQRIFAPDKIVTIPNGIDVERFASAVVDQVRNHRPRVGMVGHIAPIKGQEDFVRAAAIASHYRNDIEFVIAGEDKADSRENRRALEKLISELMMEESVRLLGWTDDIAPFLSTLDVYVSPARSEPFGLSIVEAMAAGVPVVATASEGACEIIDDNETGRLVPIGEGEIIAATILDLLEDQSERERLSQNARVAAGKRFSLERMVEETERIYFEALGHMLPQKSAQ
ncbi:MAG TPA: glycosyltransferase family 4 protein [Pyrinomonadaceae bacterium]|nr:glycosyltransferase family 4 protein [Pyrinomonadaceae bacterium]